MSKLKTYSAALLFCIASGHLPISVALAETILTPSFAFLAPPEMQLAAFIANDEDLVPFSHDLPAISKTQLRNLCAGASRLSIQQLKKSIADWLKKQPKNIQV